MILLSLAAPATGIAQTDLEAATAYGRHLEDQISILRGELLVAKSDSLTAAKIHILDLAGKDQQIEWLRERLPRWYERPVFVGMVVMVATIYVMGQTLSITF